MTHWNHRVYKRLDKASGDYYYTIREVFYSENGEIEVYTEPTTPLGEDLDGLRWTLEKMLKALNK